MPGGSRLNGRVKVRSRYDLEDFVALVWRQRFFMLTVFIVVLAIGVGAAFTLKKTYAAHSSLLIQLGQQYVYNPAVGDAARGAASTNDQVIQSEVEILNSAALKERVIHRIGYGRLFPKAAGAYNAASTDERRVMDGMAVKSIESGLKIETAPDTSVVRLTYSDRDPHMAAEILNTLIDEYMVYRKTVLNNHDVTVLRDQRVSFQTQLNQADAAYQKFLTDNGIGDFETEKTSLNQLYGSLQAEGYSIQAQLGEADGRLAATQKSMASAPPEVSLYRDVDQTAQSALTKLRIERQDLLSRYKPDAQPVRENDQQIAALQAIPGGGDTGASARRIGVNPVYQSLQTERNQLEAQTASLRDRQAAIAASLQQITDKRQKLSAIEPQNDDLARQRDALSANVKTFISREQESQAAQAIAQKADDNIRVVERAYEPVRGASLRQPVLMLAVLFAGFAAICAGLLRAFLSRGFPTAAYAERTLELPVLVSTPYKHGADA